MVSIISNIAAVGAQSNLKKANEDSAASIARLSSGEAIDKASTDVAGLAIGTILKTNVSTLGSALKNTAQAQSLLGVADGALKNVGELLQRQKALATQATSGTLSSTERGFLDQEFQELKNQINQISDTTNFNGVKLLDGSLFEPTDVDTLTRRNSTNVVGVLNSADTAIADGETIDIAGVQFTAYTAAASFTGDPKEFLANATGATQMQNLYDAIQATIDSTDSANFADRARLSELEFELNGASLTISTKGHSTEFNSGGTREINVVGSGTIGANVIDLNGTDINGATVELSAGGTAATDGDLAAGTFATGGPNAYSGTATTITRGTIGDNILVGINEIASAIGTHFNDTGVDTSGIANNAAFVGNNISGFEATYVSDNFVNLSVTVGDYTYQAKNVQTNLGAPGANNIVRLGSIEDGGGFFDIQLNDVATSGLSAVEDQSKADVFAERLDRAFETLDFFQQRKIDSYTAAGTVFPTGSTTASGNLAGTEFDLVNNDFSNNKIEAIKVEAPVTGGTEALVEFTIDGEVYRSGYDGTGATSALGNSIGNGTTVGFVNTTDPRRMLRFTNNSGSAINITDASEAEGLQKALERAFGVGEGSNSLSFQIGLTENETISVKLEGSRSTDLYRDAEGNVRNDISVTTLDNANEAGVIVDNAIKTVTALRASVGALQSRFDFAAANIESSQTNLDSARGTYLDADVAKETTEFATAQVRLQASISVLAQANQMPQSLLKLIG